MNEAYDPLMQLLSDVILPNLKSVQVSQSEQIAANDRLEIEIDELRLHLNSQFAHLTAQLTACRAEIAATQEVLKAVRMQAGMSAAGRDTLIH
jgi:CO dehydrogenase/acetyl-CoA synthase delta subunit